MAQIAHEDYHFDLSPSTFRFFEEALPMLLPSTPNTVEGIYADWMLYCLRFTADYPAANAFALLLDASILTFRLTYGTDLTGDARTRFMADYYEAYEVLTVLRDEHAARAAFLMAFLRAARTLTA